MHAKGTSKEARRQHGFEAASAVTTLILRPGKVWLRRSGQFTLVSPPSLYPLAKNPSAFGLQAAVPLGKVSVRTRVVSFDLGAGNPVEGEAITVDSQTYLVLSAEPGLGFSALEAARGW